MGDNQDLTKILNPGLNYKTADGRIHPFKWDEMTRALTTIDYAHHEIHGGSHYFVVGSQDLLEDEALDMQWFIPSGDKHLHWTWTISTGGELTWYVYENPTLAATNAIEMPIYNSNRNSDNTSISQIFFNTFTTAASANANGTNVNAAGTKTLKFGKTPAAGFKGAGGGGLAGRDSELILKSDTLYCLRAVAAEDLFINFDMEWYEHTDKSDG